jgi:hypothetical protein
MLKFYALLEVLLLNLFFEKNKGVLDKISGLDRIFVRWFCDHVDNGRESW